MRDPATRARGRKAGAPPPSAAYLGVVRVGPDFADEYPDGDPSAAEACATLVRVGSSVIGEIERAMLATFDASQVVLNSLAVIDGADEPLTPSQISERTFSWSGTMTGTLDTLESRGWVRRTPNPDDRRSVLVEITEQGRQVADQLLPGIRKLELAMLSQLSPAERISLTKLLGKVLAGAAVVAAEDPIPLEGRRRRSIGSR